MNAQTQAPTVPTQDRGVLGRDPGADHGGDPLFAVGVPVGDSASRRRGDHRGCLGHGERLRAGRGVGVPGMREAYHDQLDTKKWGLREVAKLLRVRNSPTSVGRFASATNSMFCSIPNETIELQLSILKLKK